MTPPQSKPAQSKPALLLAAHGTTDQAGVDAFAALTERVGELAAADGTRVAGGFIELSEPPLREAVTGLAARPPQGLSSRSRSCSPRPGTPRATSPPRWPASALATPA